MKIYVAANHKYIDEVQTVAQIFLPHARFKVGSFNGFRHDINIEPATERATYPKQACYISSFFECDKVCAEFCEHGKTPERYELHITCQLSFLNEKRIAMLAVYHLLQKVVGAYTPWGALTGVRPTKMVRQWIDEGKPEDTIVHYLEDILCVHTDRAQLALSVACTENRLAKVISGDTGLNKNGDTVGIYISIPFCPSRCVYCSFNVAHKPWSVQEQARYVQAVLDECREVSRYIHNNGLSVSSVYIGGGTPTVLEDGLLDNLLSCVQGYFIGNDVQSSQCTCASLGHEYTMPVHKHINSELEYTVEAGRPDTITRDKLKLMRRYGVNRISINPQTFNDKTLEAIGRRHCTQDFLNAFNMAREEGFACINTDIIAGLPGEGVEDMQHTMEALAALRPENVTVHTLAIKRASILNKQRAEQKLSHTLLEQNNCDPQSFKTQLQIAHEGCAAMGLLPYYLYRQKNMAALFENTGYSLPGHECLYNVGMMSEVQTVLGIGAGAVSKFIEGTKITRKFNVKNPEIYIERRQIP